MKSIKVGLLGLMLDLYDKTNPDLRKTQEKFAAQISAILKQYARVVYSGIVNKKQKIEEAIKKFEKEKVSLVIIVHFSYAPSLISVESLVQTNLPLLLWNTQKIDRILLSYSDKELLENHGMHGVQDLSNVLNRRGRKFIVVTGHWKDKVTIDEIAGWIKSAGVVNKMKHSRVGLLGYVFPGMGDFCVDESILTKYAGTKIYRISVDELSSSMNSVRSNQISSELNLDKKRFKGYDKIENKVLEESVKIELALRKVISNRQLSGVAIHYPAISVDSRFSALPFLAVSKLLADGIGFGGEGDVTSATACVLMKEIAGEVNFTEMFSMDFVRGEILFSHFAEGNWKMANPKYPVRFFPRPGWLSPKNPSVSLGFTAKPGKITLLNLTSASDGSIKLITTTGLVKDRPPLKLETPHFIFKPDLNLKDFLNSYSQEGGSHHLAMAYGDHREEIMRVAHLAGIGCKTI